MEKAFHFQVIQQDSHILIQGRRAKDRTEGPINSMNVSDQDSPWAESDMEVTTANPGELLLWIKTCESLLRHLRGMLSKSLLVMAGSGLIQLNNMNH